MDKNEKTKQPDNIIYNQNDSSVSSFISYLIAALDCKGINLFHGFKLLLVIFSRDYASSVSCLENLVKHLELSRCDKNSNEVVPVFYGVSRSAVKQQLGTFNDAFTKLEMSYTADQVTNWRCALAETAELQGHEYNDDLSEESKFLEEIVQAVFEKLYPTEEIAIHRRQEEIENLLCEQPWGVRTIGIFGEPGIGKTTLARAVFRRMSRGYDDACFLNDFQTNYNETRLAYLPPEYFSETPMEKFDLNSSDSEPLIYRKKRVLIALDDVVEARDAKSFLGGFDKFGPGSLIIITSRDKQILEECNMKKIYELKGLNDEDALKLFTRCAFGKDDIDENLLDLKAIECCNGNPSALRSYANEFKANPTIEMESALPAVSEVFITGNHVSCVTVKNTYIHTSPYEEDDELQANKEFPSDHSAVLATRDTIIVIGLITSDTSDRWFYRLDYYSVKSLFEHLRRKRYVLHQRLANHLQKCLQMFSNTSDLDLPELVLNFSDADIQVVQRKR